MPHYIVLINWTEQGIRNAKDSINRAQAARSQAEKMGGKLEVYYTLGEYDIVAHVEMPNDDTAMQFLLWLGSLGNVRTKTLKAWTEAEAAKIVAKP